MRWSAAFVLSCSIVPAMAQVAGDIDSTWAGDGVFEFDFPGNDVPTGLGVQSDHKVVVLVSTLDTCNGYIARLLPDGSPDTTFGDGGTVSIEALPCVPLQYHVGLDLQIDALDRIVLCGWHADHCWVARLTPEGAIDADFGAGGAFTYTPAYPNANNCMAHCLTLDPLGRMLLSVEQQNTFASDSIYVLRLLPDGTLDPDFGHQGRTDIPYQGDPGTFKLLDTGVLPSGSIYGVASFAFTAPEWYSALVKLRPDGGLDSTFSGDGIDAWYMGPVPYVTQYFSRLIVVGSELLLHGSVSWSSYNTVTALLDSTGALVPTFGTGGKAWVEMANEEITFGPSNSPVARGVPEDGPQGTPRIVMTDTGDDELDVVRLMPDGSLDMGFGTNGRSQITLDTAIINNWTMALDGCRIYVAVNLVSELATDGIGAIVAVRGCNANVGTDIAALEDPGFDATIIDGELMVHGAGTLRSLELLAVDGRVIRSYGARTLNGSWQPLEMPEAVSSLYLLRATADDGRVRTVRFFW